MGCSASKSDNEEVVQVCRDRRNFIKKAVEERKRFASGHIAYIESLKRVSLALRNYVDGDDHQDFLLDSYTTPPFTPVKKLSPEIVTFHFKPFTPPENQTEKSTARVVSYLRSVGEPAVAVEEWPESPETMRIESYYSTDHYGFDGFFAAQSSPYHNRPNHPESSPQTSQWDFFWNPFSSLDQYGYAPRESFDQITSDDEMARIRQVREEEGIPDLEEDGDENPEDVEEFKDVEIKDAAPKAGLKIDAVEVAKDKPADVNMESEKVDCVKEAEKVHDAKEVRSQGVESVQVSAAPNAVELEVASEHAVVGNSQVTETPGFTVYVNRRPINMAEVMRDVDCQFVRICDTAHDVSVMLETSRGQYSSRSSELAGIKMLNPVALFRSGSLRSTSSRFLQASYSTRDDGDDSCSEYSEESCMVSGSHQSTLDRLYAWEKKLYEEVKSGERIRIAYEKKCMQLRNHDVNGEEPSVVDRTRAAIRELRTRLQVHIHTVESVSKRIEKLRDEELHPQLMELIQGLARMWATMADCHRIQKRTIDEAKLLPSATPMPFGMTPPIPSRSAANLEAALRHWRSCLEAWIESQRSYARALAGWATRCAQPGQDADTSRTFRSPLSPGPGGGAPPPAFAVCRRWSRLLDSVTEERAVEGVDFFAAGIGSVCTQQRERAAAAPLGDEMPPEREAEVVERVMCAGMSVAAGALAEFAGAAAEGYEAVVRRCRDGGGGRDVRAGV